MRRFLHIDRNIWDQLVTKIRNLPYRERLAFKIMRYF